MTCDLIAVRPASEWEALADLVRRRIVRGCFRCQSENASSRVCLLQSMVGDGGADIKPQRCHGLRLRIAIGPHDLEVRPSRMRMARAMLRRLWNWRRCPTAPNQTVCKAEKGLVPRSWMIGAGSARRESLGLPEPRGRRPSPRRSHVPLSATAGSRTAHCPAKPRRHHDRRLVAPFHLAGAAFAVAMHPTIGTQEGDPHRIYPQNRGYLRCRTLRIQVLEQMQALVQDSQR